MELFQSDKNTSEIFKPLAERCRPTTFQTFFGQEHLIHETSLIRSMIHKKNLRSIILWGPPGSGKTTLAYIIARQSKIELFALNAISSGVQDVRKVIEKGKIQAKHYARQVILFIDEIHRFNKAQQDSLLYAVEHGEIVLIGATTENPSFEINPPLLSRCKVLKLQALLNNEIQQVVMTALNNDPKLKNLTINIEEEAMTALIQWVNGDARKALNILESSVELLVDPNNAANNSSTITITSSTVQQAAQKKLTQYDKKGDFHYDVISAFIKSIRGSDPNAAIYYLATMLEGGEDIEFIARRLIISASEDIGNADPQALTLATSCFTAIKNIGLPEARIILAQTTTYLASAPKSNASYLAIDKATEAVKTYGCDVPLHIRNAPTKLMKEMGYGKEYQYPHDFDNHFIKENYLPESVKNLTFYHPGNCGYEQTIKTRLETWWQQSFSQ